MDNFEADNDNDNDHSFSQLPEGQSAWVVAHSLVGEGSSLNTQNN